MSGQSQNNPEIITFGCRLNTYESEIIRQKVAAARISDVFIVNTCAVTAEAERQARQTIRRLRRNSPYHQIIVTGCAAQLRPDVYAAMPEVDSVLGNMEKLSEESYKSTVKGEVRVSDIMKITETAGHLIEGFDGRTRAFLEIQQGCNHRCTFCTIPFARGPNRSVPLGHIIAETQRLVSKGFREIVLTGVDITAYGEDLENCLSLSELVYQLLREVPDLMRLRLSSLDPFEIGERLKEIISYEKRLMPHIHLSLQAGDDLTLKRMRRRHTRRDAVRLCDDLRKVRPDIVFGADFIVGFPTEDDRMFNNTLDLVEDCGLTYLHVFSYSARNGTPAARMPQVAKAVRKQRSIKLRNAGIKALEAYLVGRIGRTEMVLIEDHGVGRTEGYARVEFVTDTAKPGGVVPMAITGRTKHNLLGQVVT